MAATAGNAPIVQKSGEPHTVRTDLGVNAGARRATKRTSVLAFAHLTDVHLIDEQSPMRVEYVDRSRTAIWPLPSRPATTPTTASSTSSAGKSPCDAVLISQKPPVPLGGKGLAANDPQQRASAQEGVKADRNVELLVSNPLA